MSLGNMVEKMNKGLVMSHPAKIRAQELETNVGSSSQSDWAMN